MTVYRYDDKTPGAWGQFIAAMNSGEEFECDESMFDYWLGVLPPVYMRKAITLPNGRQITAHFGFAEGEEAITAFWRERGDTPGSVRYFGCRTNTINQGH